MLYGPFKGMGVLEVALEVTNRVSAVLPCRASRRVWLFKVCMLQRHSLLILNGQNGLPEEKCSTKTEGKASRRFPFRREAYFSLDSKAMSAMKTLAILFLFLTTLSEALAQEEFKCNEDANQLELNECAKSAFDKADRELNEVFTALVRKDDSDQDFVRKLRRAQRAWIAFRDAELDATYYCKEGLPQVCWGSMIYMSELQYKLKLTSDRTARLRKLLKDGRPADGYY